MTAHGLMAVRQRLPLRATRALCPTRCATRIAVAGSAAWLLRACRGVPSSRHCGLALLALAPWAWGA